MEAKEETTPEVVEEPKSQKKIEKKSMSVSSKITNNVTLSRISQIQRKKSTPKIRSNSGGSAGENVSLNQKSVIHEWE